MQYNPLDINILKTLQNPELKLFLLLWIQEINQGSAKSSITICCMYGISIYGIFLYNPFLFYFFFCDFWTLFFMTTSYLQIPEEFPLPLRPVLLQHQHLPAYKHSGLRSVQITIRIFFYITVDSLFNMKYLPLIHCFELNRENIKLRAPNFCYNII